MALGPSARYQTRSAFESLSSVVMTPLLVGLHPIWLRGFGMPGVLLLCGTAPASPSWKASWCSIGRRRSNTRTMPSSPWAANWCPSNGFGQRSSTARVPQLVTAEDEVGLRGSNTRTHLADMPATRSGEAEVGSQAAEVTASEAPAEKIGCGSDIIVWVEAERCAGERDGRAADSMSNTWSDSDRPLSRPTASQL